MQRPKGIRLEVVLFILGSLLVLPSLGSKSLWTDEIAVDWITKGTLRTAVSHCRGATGLCYSPPLNVLCVYFAKQIANTEFMIRLPAALFGIALLIAFWKWTAAMLPRGPALICLFLMVISPCHIYHSQDARMYILMSLCTVLALWLMGKIIGATEKKLPLAFLALGAVHIVNLYLSYFAWLVLGNLFLTFFVMLFWPWQKAVIYRNRKIVLFGVTHLLILAAYSPWLKDLLALSRRHSSGSVAPSAVVNSHFIWKLLTELCGGGWAGPVVLLLVLVGAFAAARRARAALCCGSMSLGLSLAFLAVVQPSYEFNSRYFFFLHPLLILAAGVGLWTLVETLKTGSRFLQRTCAVALVILSALPCIYEDWKYYSVDKSGWTEASEFIVNTLPADTKVMPGIHFSNASINRYLFEKHPELSPARLGPKFDFASFRDTVLTNPRLWYVTHGWTHHDPQIKALVERRFDLMKTCEGYDPYRHVLIFAVKRTTDVLNRRSATTGIPTAVH